MNRSQPNILALMSPLGRWVVMALLLANVGLLAGCGASSRAISIIGPSAPQLLSISVAPPGGTLAAGLTLQYAATGVYSDGTTADVSSSVTWASTAAGVAVISNAGGKSGLATAVSAGGTTITATLGTIVGSTTLTVTGATLVSIAVTPTLQSVPQDTPLQYTATGVYSNNSLQNLTANVTWTSSNPSVASISGTGGLANTLTAGTTTITATLGTFTASTTLTVTAAALTSINVTPATSSITGGTTEPLTATGIYSDKSTHDLTDYATWSSSNPSLASVSNAAGSQGVVTAISQGGVTISATYGGSTGTASVSIAAVALTSITITPLTASIAKGSNLQFTATGVYSNNSTQNITNQVTWTSGNTTLVTISSTGFAAALAAGQTTIQATLGGISGSVPITVTSPTLVSIAITTTTQLLNVKQSEQFTATGTYADGSHATITTSVIWTSSNTASATITAGGVATGVALGTSAITASLGGVTSNSVTLTVVEIAYALNFNSGGNTSGSITEFRIQPTGQLTVLGTIVPGDEPYDMAIDPTNSYAYVLNYSSASISGYIIDPDGTLAAADTPTGTGAGPNGIALDPTGSYLYVANYDATNFGLSEYSYSTPGGALTALPGSPLSLTASSNAAAVATYTIGAATYVYVSGGSAQAANGEVYEYQVQSNGTLTPLTSPTITSGTGPYDIVVDPNPAARYAYTTNYFGGTVSEYIIGADGVLSPNGSGTVAAGQSPSSITIDAAGKNAYVTNRGDGTIGQYTINSDGTLGNPRVVSLGANTQPSWLAIDPSGQFAYVTERVASGNTIAEFSISPTDGSLTSIGAAQSTGTDPVAIFTAP